MLWMMGVYAGGVGLAETRRRLPALPARVAFAYLYLKQHTEQACKSHPSDVPVRRAFASMRRMMLCQGTIIMDTPYDLPLEPDAAISPYRVNKSMINSSSKIQAWEGKPSLR
jgi:hypothetical protein